MTVIAFRDGVLAADSEVHRDDARCGSRNKIWRVKGGRVAIMGWLPLALAIADWIEKGRPGEMPMNAPPDEVGSCAFFPDRGQPTLLEEGHESPLPRARFHAFGIGAHIALGAMWKGATAEEAVRAAIDLHALCGGRVRVLKPL